MYLNWNDYELLYLIKEGIEVAKQVLYHKYTHLIYKSYLKCNLNYSFLYSDYLQESLMSLEQAIYRYDDRFSFSFYAYYSLILSHLTIKVKKGKSMRLTERFCQYLENEPSYAAKQNGILYLLRKEVSKEPELIQNMYEYCFLRGGSLTQFCREHTLNYMQMYKNYKKLAIQLEKILTKWLE